MTRSFLLIGIAWSEFPKMVGAEKSESMIAVVKGMLAKGNDEFKAAGLRSDSVFYGPDESMTRLQQILSENKYDGVCIGWGIRSTAMYTELFERLVTTVHETSPSSKLLFNSSPATTFDAVMRGFPEVQRASA
ncbi:hypothetical protein P7C73_g6070, partial [Tremellales sp. Uapishka_1]